MNNKSDPKPEIYDNGIHWIINYFEKYLTGLGIIFLMAIFYFASKMTINLVEFIVKTITNYYTSEEQWRSWVLYGIAVLLPYFIGRFFYKKFSKKSEF